MKKVFKNRYIIIQPLLWPLPTTWRIATMMAWLNCSVGWTTKEQWPGNVTWEVRLCKKNIKRVRHWNSTWTMDLNLCPTCSRGSSRPSGGKLDQTTSNQHFSGCFLCWTQQFTQAHRQLSTFSAVHLLSSSSLFLTRRKFWTNDKRTLLALTVVQRNGLCPTLLKNISSFPPNTQNYS